MKVVQKYIGREPSGRTFNEIALDYNGQPHNPMVCVISNQPAKMIELFCNFFLRSTVVPSCLLLFFCTWSNQSWLFPRSLNMSTISSQGSFSFGIMCDRVINHKLDLSKKGETTWQIGWSPHCARPSDLSIPRRLGGGTFSQCWRRHDICQQKKIMPPAVLEPKNSETKWRSEYLLICNESVWVSVSTNITSGAGLPRFRLRLPNLIPLSGFSGLSDIVIWCQPIKWLSFFIPINKMVPTFHPNQDGWRTECGFPKLNLPLREVKVIHEKE